MNSPERVQGNIIGLSSIAVALLFVTLAVFDNGTYSMLGWLGAVSGWWLLGLSMMKLGEERSSRAAPQQTPGA